ncbi:tyrosine-type recombinase/integrase [Nocardioides sp. NPDC127503]|uniref:tyrosine-type recombinase/integrase n=1 Tax=Nocardioides sp. NPDC127503 TaxID=3154516 RepID=UPI003333709D
MSVQRYTTPSGKVRYRARVKHHGVEVATSVFDRKRDAEDWEADQKRRLRLGEWHDPRRGQVALSVVAVDWLDSRHAIKRKTRALEEAAWRLHIAPKFGKRPVASITPADVATWVGRLVAAGAAQSTVSRHLAVFRNLLDYAVRDGRITKNPAAQVAAPTTGKVRREGQFLTRREVEELANTCDSEYGDVVRVLALAGLRWSELAGLKVGDRVQVPGQGIRVQRTVMSSMETGTLYEDIPKGKRSRTVPLVADLVPIFDRWCEGKEPGAWIFAAPKGGPLSERNWKRSVGWSDAVKRINRPTLRVHDLRHTCASLWLAAGADPKVLQRILGHASAAMTMDLYGHLVDDNLWTSAERLGGTLGASDENDSPENEGEAPDGSL